jgi:hypothetical protein
MRALTKSPGHSASSLLGNSAFSRMAAAAWSMMLSIRTSLPVASALRLFWSKAVTSTGPRFMASRTSPREVAGSVNRTADGWLSTKPFMRSSY